MGFFEAIWWIIKSFVTFNTDLYSDELIRRANIRFEKEQRMKGYR